MPTAKRTVARKAAATKAVDIVSTLRQFLTLKVQREALEDRENDLKKILQHAVETAGYEDDKGNYWLDLDEPLEVDGYGVVPRLKRERRVAFSVDETKAEAILAKKGILDECTTMVPVLDEEEIRKAHFKGVLTDAEIEAIFPAKVTWAFKPEKQS